MAIALIHFGDAKPDPGFDVLTSTTYGSIGGDELRALFGGLHAALVIEQLLTTDEMAQIAADARTVPVESYGDRVTPPIMKLGEPLYNHREHLDRYAVAVEESDAVFARHFGIDPRLVLLQRLSERFVLPIEPLPIRGVPRTCIGILRDISNGARIHADSLHREAPGLGVPVLAAQIAVNLIVEAGDAGGECEVFDHLWRPGLARFDDGYGYHQASVFHDPFASIKGVAGDCVFFRPLNLHRVNPTIGARRVTLSCFLGLAADGSCLYAFA